MVVAVACGLSAVISLAAFVVWSDQYLRVVYNADETSTTPHFAAGFIPTGFGEAAAFVAAATTAFLAGLVIVRGERAYRANGRVKLITIGAPALVASAIPIGILHPIFAVLPLSVAAVVGILSKRS